LSFTSKDKKRIQINEKYCRVHLTSSSDSLSTPDALAPGTFPVFAHDDVGFLCNGFLRRFRRSHGFCGARGLATPDLPSLPPGDVKQTKVQSLISTRLSKRWISEKKKSRVVIDFIQNITRMLTST
jgi:hypothetical protein